MRLVLDLQSAQGESSQRGIGRQSLGFSRALARYCRGHEVVVAVSDRFPGRVDPVLDHFRDLVAEKNLVTLSLPGPVAWNLQDNAELRKRAEKERESRLAALRPDVVHLNSLFEGLVDESVTTVKPTGRGYASSVTLHDLMPLIHPGTFVTGPEERAWYEHKVAQLHSADLLLAVSESSRVEGLRHLGLGSGRVVTISAAADAGFRRHVYREDEIRKLYSLYGIEKPFLMFTGGDSPQKNIEGLLRAYAALTGKLRRGHQLVLACKILAENRARFRSLANSLGLEKKDLVYTGYIPDAHLTALYNTCRAFVFPSWHEGFGLPVLEAMSCGAAVIGSDCTSIPEVIGRRDALFDPHRTEDIAAKLHQVLTDGAFRTGLAEYGLQRSREFSWEMCAARGWDAFEALADKKTGENVRASVTFPAASDPEKRPTDPEAVSLLPQALQEGVEYRVGGPFSFLSFLGSGWSNPESWGIWSEDHECTLWVRVEKGREEPRVLEMNVRPHLRWGYSLLFFQVRVNGRLELARVAWRAQKLRIPLRQASPEGIHFIRISIANPRMPPATKTGQDHRMLGLGLLGLVLRR